MSPNIAIQGNTNYDTLLNDASIQMAASHLSKRPNRISYGLTSKRHSARIEKPRSINPSPKPNEGRRRTLTAVKHYPSLEEHYRAMFGDEPSTPKEEPAQRPFSWHPTSSQMFSSTTQSPTIAESTMEQPYFIPEPVSFPMTADMSTPVYAPQQYSLPSNSWEQAYCAQAPPYSSQTSMQDTSSWQSYYCDGQTPIFSTISSYAALPNEQTSWYVPDYSQLLQAQPQLLPSPASFPNDMLPMQKPDTPVEENDETEEWDDDGEVLIGLGLHDPPSSSPPPFGISQGMGLKLAETWQPPPMNDDDDDDKSSDEDDEEEEIDQTQTVQGENASGRNLVGQSFFFEEEDSITNEWWYKQLKKPAVQDSGLGFGWLQTAS